MADDAAAANEEYLAAALAWLRLLLTRFAQSGQPEPAAVPTATEVDAGTNDTDAAATATVADGGGRPRKRHWWTRPDPTTTPGSTKPPMALPPARVSAADVHAAASRMAEAASVQPPPAMVALAAGLGLSPFEANVVLLCAAVELDPAVGPLIGRAQGFEGRMGPTFALAFHLFEGAAWDALSPHRPLRHWRLVEIAQSPGQPLTASLLRADERIVNFIKGLNELDDRLDLLVGPPLPADDGQALPPSQQAVVDLIVHRWHQAEADAPSVIELLGPDRPSKLQVASRVAAQLGRRLYRVPADLLPTQPAELEGVARLWHRESVLLPIALYLDADDDAGSSLPRFLAHSDGVFFVAAPELLRSLGRTAVSAEVGRPTVAEQRAAWLAALGPGHDDLADGLAGQFRLDIRTIAEIARTGLADEAEGAALATTVWDDCLASTRPAMDALAQRITPKATWDDLVLPDDEVALLRQVADQVGQRTKVYDDWGFAAKMSRGFGISALFAGPSGAGKSMAAEVIANHLRLNLYRIDLSAVVSKYIGETEKNLGRLFDAAEAGGALLFFDEADSLFSKRSEVKDSHDRYANMEVNYLLQRMESYSGIAILASNMKAALDAAFMRRLRFIVNFRFPAAEERKHMWQKVFPATTPVSGLDFDRLAALSATGGMIHNIALNAAFLAAARRLPVTMPLVLDAARTEFRKLDQPIVEADFVWTEPVGARS